MSELPRDICQCVGCGKDPDWVIRDTGELDPHEPETLACDDHLSVLLGVRDTSSSLGKEFVHFEVRNYRPWVWDT